MRHCKLCNKRLNHRNKVDKIDVCTACYDRYKPDVDQEMLGKALQAAGVVVRLEHAGTPDWPSLKRKYGLSFTVRCIKLHNDVLVEKWE